MGSWCQRCGRYELIGSHRSAPTPTEQIDRAFAVLVQAFWVAAAMQADQVAKALSPKSRGGDHAGTS